MSISVDSSSLRVEKVVFQGDALVAESTATQLTTDVFNAKTLDQILSASIKSAQQLSDLGISKSCNIQLDFHDDLVTVNMNLIKNSTLSINVGTSISTQSADLTAQLSIKNMSGRGDDLSLSVSQDTSLQDTLTHPTQLNAGKTFVGLLDYPVNADPFTRFQIAASSQSKNQNEISSHAQQNTQLSLKYLMLNRNAGNIEVETGVSLRNNHSIHKDASWSIRQQAGPSLKSFIAESVVFDTRDDTILPQSGFFFKNRQEIAGLLGDVALFKSETEMEVAIPLRYGFSSCLSFKNGLLIGLNKKKLDINDKFFIAGPTSLRGFKHNSIGPKDNNDYLGGSLFYNLNASLFTPIPFLPANTTLFGHFFANSGNLLDSSNVFCSKNELWMNNRLSVGCGFLLKFSILRAEFNYVFPLRTTHGDTFKTGFQFGLIV